MQPSLIEKKKESIYYKSRESAKWKLNRGDEREEATFLLFFSPSLPFLLLCHVNGACFVTAVTEESRVLWMLAKLLSFFFVLLFRECFTKLFICFYKFSKHVVKSSFSAKVCIIFHSFIVYYLGIESFLSYSLKAQLSRN